MTEATQEEYEQAGRLLSKQRRNPLRGPYQFSHAEKIARELEAEATRLVGKYRAVSVSQMFLALHREAGVTRKPELQYCAESKNIHMVWYDSVDNNTFAVYITPRDSFGWYSTYPYYKTKGSGTNLLQQFTPEMLEVARMVA